MNNDELRQVIELLAIAITADMPVTIRTQIADRLMELGKLHQANSPNAGTHCIALGKLLQQGLPPPLKHSPTH